MDSGVPKSIVGVISVDDLRIFLTEHALPPDLLVANDLRAADFRTAERQDDLASALRKMYATGLDELPVLVDDDHGKVLAMLTRRHIMSAYHKINGVYAGGHVELLNGVLKGAWG